MQPEVYCQVQTCAHWVPKDRCAAGNIDILNQVPGQPASTEQETECKTFVERRGAANLLGAADNANYLGIAAEPFALGRQITPSVTCTVDSCRYWAEGDRCAAESIDISGENAQECQETSCSTFAV